jgi:hypothetical protein
VKVTRRGYLLAALTPRARHPTPTAPATPSPTATATPSPTPASPVPVGGVLDPSGRTRDRVVPPTRVKMRGGDGHRKVIGRTTVTLGAGVARTVRLKIAGRRSERVFAQVGTAKSGVTLVRTR